MSLLCTSACGPCGQCRSECPDCGKDHDPPSCSERDERAQAALCDDEAHRLAQCLSNGGKAPKRCVTCRAWSPAFEEADRYECPVHGPWVNEFACGCGKVGCYQLGHPRPRRADANPPRIFGVRMEPQHLEIPCGDDRFTMWGITVGGRRYILQEWEKERGSKRAAEVTELEASIRQDRDDLSKLIERKARP